MTPDRGPWPRRIVVACVAVGLGAIGLWIAARVYAERHLARAVAAIEKRLGPIDATAYERPPVPDRENAFVLLEPGLEAVGEVDDPTRELWKTLILEPPETWPPEEETARSLAESGPALEALHSAAGAERSTLGLTFRSPEPEEGPTLIPYLTASKLLAAHARWSLVRGDGGAALASARTLATLAGALEREPRLIDKLIGAAIEKYLHRVAAAAIAERADPEVVRELRELLLGLPAEIGYPRALGLDAAQFARVLSDTDPAGLRRLNKYPWTELCWGDTLLGYADLADPDRSYAEVLSDTEAAYQAGRARGNGPWRPLPCPLADMLIPNVLDAGVKVYTAEAERLLAVTALDLDLHGRSIGAYPPSLEGLPTAVRPDPLTREPLRWTLRPDGSGELTYAQARAVFEGRDYDVNYPPLLVWELPPPADGG